MDRHLEIKQGSSATLSDKVVEQPLNIITNADCSTDKKGYSRNVQPALCYAFNGTSEYVLVEDADDLYAFTDGAGNDNPFSITAWVRMTDATDFPVLVKGRYGVDADWEFVVNSSDELQFALIDDSISAYIGKQSSSTITSYQSSWAFLSVTYDGTNTEGGIKLYIDGEAITMQSYSSGSYDGMENLASDLTIGYKINTADYASGRMHDVRIHNAELSVTQIVEVMNRKSSGSEIGWWKCEESAAATSYDSSGQGMHGKITGATLSTFHTTSGTLNYSFANEVGYTEVSYLDQASLSCNSRVDDRFFPDTGSFSIDMIYKSDVYSTAGHSLFGLYAGTTLPYWRVLVTNGGRIYAQIRDDASNATTIWSEPAFNIEDDEWHYITAVFDRDNDIGFLYVDGEERAGDGDGFDISSVTGSIPVTTHVSYNYYYGCGFGAATYSYDEHYYKLRYSKKARSLEEHLNFYNSRELYDDTDTDAFYSATDGRMVCSYDTGAFASYGTPLYVKIPRDEGNPNLCASGFSLQHIGRVKYDIKPIENNCVYGTGDTEAILWNSGDPLLDSATVWTVAFRSDIDLGLTTSRWIIGGDGSENILSYYTSATLGYRDSAFLYSRFNGVSYDAISGDYHSIVFYSDGTDVYVMVDGLACGAVNPVTSTALTVYSFINGYTAGSAFSTPGKFWDFRVWGSNVGTEEATKYHSDTMTTTPDHWYPMNEGAGNIIYDIVGGKHGTMTYFTMSTAWDTQDVYTSHNLQHGFTNAYHFNGTDAYLYIDDADQTGLDFGTNDVTFDFVISTADTSNDMIIDKYNSNNPRYRIYLNSGGLYVYFRDATYTAGITSSVFNDGLWHTISVVLDRDLGMSIYIDGVLDAQEYTTEWTNFDGVDFNGSADFTIGSTYYGSVWNSFLNGSIHSVRVSHKARSLAEVKYAYENGLEKDDYTQGLWVFGDTGLMDQSDNHNDLTNTNVELVRIPADYNDLTKDVIGLDIQHSAGGHNSAESAIDFTGGVAHPRSTEIYKGYGTFNGSSSYVEIPDADHLSFGNDTDGDRAFSVSAWINMNDATSFIVISKYGTEYEWVLGTDGSDYLTLIIRDESSTGYYKPVTPAITDYEGRWIHVAGTYDGSEVDTGIKLYINGVSQSLTQLGSGSYTNMEDTDQVVYIGRLSTTYTDGHIRDVRVYSGELTADDVLSEYMNGNSPQRQGLVAEYKLYKDGYDSSYYKNHGVNTSVVFSKLTVPTDYTPGTVLENPMFCKYGSDSVIECTSSGTMYCPSTIAYGTWEFDILKNGDAYSAFVDFIHDLNTTTTADGYQFRIYNTEYVALYRVDSGSGTSLMQTAAATIDLDRWYNIVIARNSTTDEYVEGAVGTFGIFIDGVLATATSGTNPVTDNNHTESNYMILDIYLGQKIKNIKINGVPVNYSTFIEGTGTYTITGSRQSNFSTFDRGQVITKPIYRYTKNEG